MKRLAFVALFLFAACEQQQQSSKLNASPGNTPGAKGVSGAFTPGTGSVEQRLAKVEATLQKYGESLEFLDNIYQQQKNQRAAQEANEPDPNAVFAVDISKAVAAGQVEGPANALVTIVEAWDFA